MALLVTLNVGHSLEGAYRAAAGPGVRVAMGPQGGFSAKYEDLAKGQTLEAFLRQHGWDGRERALVVAFSAGGWAVRRWLSQGITPDGVGVLLLDALHGTPAQVEGVSSQAVSAALDAPRRLLVVTHSAIQPPGYPSTTETAKSLLDAVESRPVPIRREGPAAGREGSFRVEAHPGADAAAHNIHQTQIGPALVRGDVGDWLRGGATLDDGIPLRVKVAGMAFAVAIGAAWWLTQRERRR